MFLGCSVLACFTCLRVLVRYCPILGDFMVFWMNFGVSVTLLRVLGFWGAFGGTGVLCCVIEVFQ